MREASAAAFRTSSSAASSAFQTSYHKIECGAIVANMCVWGGQPRYFRERGTKGFTSTGATRCCNEAHTKLRFHAVVYDASSGSSSSPSSSSLSEQLPPSLRATANDAESSTTVTIGQGGPVVVSNNTLLVTPMCWEEVGYHLFLCVLNTWALMSQLRIGHPASSTSAPPHVKIALLKSWTPNRLGNAADWWSPKRQQDTSPAQPVAAATFWAWWSVVADSPADVVDIASLPPMCVPLALVAGRAHPLTPSLQQRFRAEMLRRLRVPDPLRPRRHCETGRTSRVVVVTVVDRARTFRLLNCREIASQFARVGARLALNVSVRVVVFERLPLREQMAIAVGTDVLVGMHGNGLTWAAFMARGSALVELWPSVAYNSNYEHIAGRAGVRRWQVLGGASNNCPKRCQAAVPVSDDVVGETLRFVSAVRCGATLYDGESDYLRSLASYAEQKRQKRNKLRSGASPPET